MDGYQKGQMAIEAGCLKKTDNNNINARKKYKTSAPIVLYDFYLRERCFVRCCKNHYPTATDSDERCRSTCWWTSQVGSRYAGCTRHASLAADPATN